MRVLVTGGTGFIGSHLVQGLVTRGEEVRVLVRRTSNLDRLPRDKVAIFYGDIRNERSFASALNGVDVVYHLASLLRPINVADYVYEEVNVRGTENILKLASQVGIKRFVHCSSTGVMGTIDNPPVDESHLCLPDNVYARTKYEAEKLALRYARRGLPVTIVRPAWTYGPGDTRTLKLFQAIGSRRFLMVGDGKTLIHPAYVTNVVQGIILAAYQPKANGQVYILADENPVTVEVLVAGIAEILGTNLPRLRLPAWLATGTAYLVEIISKWMGKEPFLFRRRVQFFTRCQAFNIKKAKAELGYEPSINLETGLAVTIKWYQQHGFL